MKQKLFTLFLALVASVSAIYASYKNVDGIWYDFHEYNKTAIVTYRGDYANSYSNEYSGSVVIPSSVTYNGTTYSVTSIGSSAFRDCSSLTSVTIGESVTRIGDYAFYGCSSLTSVTIPNSVTSIGGGAFYGCSALTSVTIPNSVTSIGGNTFYGCSSLTSVTIPNSVTSIGGGAFYGCSSLTSVTIPNSVTSIGEYAFYGCSSLTSVTIPNSVTSIGEYAFEGCSALTSVTIPESVTSIGSSAFRDCSALTSVTIPNSVTSIGEYAFEGCSSLTSVTIPESVTSIGYAAFEDCSSLTSVTINSDAIVNKQYSQKSNLSHIFGSQVTEYVIGDNVKGIGEYAFRGCSSLTSVTIPNSVTSIGWDAFYGCSSLTSITIPESVTRIGEYAFEGCSSLTSVTINSDAIVNKAYTFSSNISNIFGSQVTEYIIGDNVKGIGKYAFRGCSSLTSVTIPESVTSIGDWAFQDCSSLTSVTIPNSVTSIGVEAFYNCSSLTSITIPESVTSIGNSAFAWCESLTSINVNANNPNYCSQDGVLFNKDKTTLVQYPIGNTRTEYTIPNSVTSIGDRAFYGCTSLTSVTIPNSVTRIGYRAFYKCSSLLSITCEAETPPTVGSDAFYNVSKSIPVYVPCGGVGAYKAASGWSDFTNIQVPLAEYSIEVDVNDNIMGTAKVDKNNACGNQISATPNFGYHFVQWSDGSTDTIRTLELTQDTTLTAEFAPNQYTVTTLASHSERGTTQGDTTVNYLDSVTITANSNYGYHFVQWNDGNTENPRQVQVTGDTTYTATFDKNTYAISLSCNEEQGSVEGVTSAEYLDTVTISATPNIGYHFVQWNDGNTDNPRTLVLTQDITLTAEFAQSFSGQCGDSLYWELIDTTLQITGKGEMYDYKSNTIPWKLLVSSIKVLTIAEDVTKLSQSFGSCSVLESIVWNAKHAADTYSDGQYVYPIFYEIRSQIKSFTFGENVEYIPTYLCIGMDKLTSMTIPNSVTSIGEGAFYICSSLTSVTIGNSVISIGKGAFKDCSSLTSVTISNSVTSIGEKTFYNCSSLTSVTIPNSVKTIGTSAFEGCARLGKISLGTGLEEIAANAFAECTRLYDIYSYATYPPFAEESSFANYNVYVYVPCEYQRDYTLDIVWGKFKFIECIDSEDTTTDGNVTVVPGYNDVTITWPTAENADTYSLVINKDNQPFCTLTFNQEGQLLNIAFAPSRDGNNRPAQYAEQAVNGYRFTVTGLTEATQYVYNITTKDAANKTIATYSGEFTTMGGVATSIEDILHSTTNCQKIIRNGQLIIIRDGVEYNAVGQEM